MLAKTTDIINAREEIVKKLGAVADSLNILQFRVVLDAYNEETIKKSVELLYSYYCDIRKELLDFDNRYWFLKDEELEHRLRGDIGG